MKKFGYEAHECIDLTLTRTMKGILENQHRSEFGQGPSGNHKKQLEERLRLVKEQS